MKPLFIVIVFFLSFLPFVGHASVNHEAIAFVIENQNDSPSSDNTISLDSDDDIEFVATVDLPWCCVVGRGETIDTFSISLKSQFSFCMWRPPRV